MPGLHVGGAAISNSIWLRTRRSSPVLRSATLAPTTMVLMLVSITARETPRIPLATSPSVSPRPRWSLSRSDRVFRSLFDRMDEAVHGRDHRDGDEGDD